MEQIDPSMRSPLSLEQVALEALALQTLPDLPSRAQRFLTTIQAWAAPSAIVCVQRDLQAPNGWRPVPELTSGQTPPGFDQFLAQLGEEGDSITRPFLIRPTEQASGVKIRDTWVIPWSHLQASGFVILRGTPRPYPANLGEAISLLAQPLMTLAATTGTSASMADLEAARAQRDESWAARDAVLAERDRARQALDEALTDRDQARLDRDGLLAERERLQAELEKAQAERDQARAETERLRSESERPRPEGDAMGRERDEAIVERDRLQSETARLQAEIEKAQAERDQARTEAERLRTESDQPRSDLQDVRRERDEALDEARGLRGRVTELEAGAAAGAAASDTSEALASAQRERDEASKAAEEAREECRRIREEQDRTAQEDRSRLEAAVKAREAAEAEREFAKGEAGELRGRLEALNQRIADADEARKQAHQQTETAEGEKTGLVAERDRLQAQINQLWSSIESFQRDLKGERERIQTERAAMDAARRTEEKAVEEAAHRAAIAEKERDEWRTLHTGTVQTFRDAVKAARRTPFASPTLRMALEEAEKLLDPDALNRKGWPRALFLDRDPFGLERLATDLEASGIEALVANYPEEVGFFLKTPDARGLSTIICDVMAFRPDHNLAEIFKAWRQDAAGIAMLLSFRADNATEAERAQRIPSVMTAGYLPRPIQRDVLTDAIHAAHRRHVGKKA